MRRYNLFIPLVLLFTVVFYPVKVHASVQDFTFSSFNSDYYLSKDSEGRSTLKVVEKLVANFPDYNQNKGIVRYIPIRYDGHSLSFKLISLKRNDMPETIYSKKNSFDFMEISTGTDQYLTGRQTYEITYTLRDVIKNYGDQQEFYWDVNGTGWSQTFSNVSATVHIDPSLIDNIGGGPSCYQGSQGSNTKCTISNNRDIVLFKSITSLQPYQTLTLNMVFKKNTFSPYKFSINELKDYWSQITFLIILVLFILIKTIFGRDNKGRGTIVPQYLPPKGLSISESYQIERGKNKQFTAQIIDFAVRHKLRIIEEGGDRAKFPTKNFSLELISVDGLNATEKEFLALLFTEMSPGAKYYFSKVDFTLGPKIRKFWKSNEKMALINGYRIYKKSVTIVLVTLVFLMFIVFILGYSVSLGPGLVVYPELYIMAVLIILFFTIKTTLTRPLTAKGRDLKDYLMGLKMYIKLAESDRIKFLQSPQGAERKQINTNDKSQMIVLYERVLPYAVFFGIEKDWAKQMEVYYKDTNTMPSWYIGATSFNITDLSSGISSFSSYIASSSIYSSTSGSGGGGSAGGGGGGGGGGGR